MRKNLNSNIPTLHGETGLVYNDCDKANALADVFEKVHKLTVDLSDDLTEKLSSTIIEK